MKVGAVAGVGDCTEWTRCRDDVLEGDGEGGGGAVEGIEAVDGGDNTEGAPCEACLKRLEGTGDVGKGSSCEDAAAFSASRISRVMSERGEVRRDLESS